MTGNMKIGNRTFTFGKKVYIMGILNVTPDSFSDGGKFDTLEHAMAQVEKMIEEGADLIDVGGESTRPGHQQITEDEEIARVVPVIQKIKEKYDIPVSIDTYKSRVAEAALEAGADMLNDIWGFLYDEKMAELAVRYDVPVCLMHNRNNTEYQDFVPDVVADLKKCLAVAEKYGVKKENIMLDPGVGFGKTYEQNLAIINHLEVLCDMGYPVLLATSRKSVIGLTLDLPVTEREEGTIATSVIGAMKGCDFVRSLASVNKVNCDIAISTNGGYPLDQNIYQAIKGMTAAEATLPDDGIIIMIAGCRDGHGGVGFYHNIADVKDPEEFEQKAIHTPRLETVPDQWTSQIFARILAHHKVIMVSDLVDPKLVKDMHMELASNVNEALAMAFKIKGNDAKVAVIPDGLGVVVNI